MGIYSCGRPAIDARDEHNAELKLFSSHSINQRRNAP
jgi:hypothetical protein